MKLNSNNKYCFEFNDVINILVELSHSQGFYGRLLRDLSEIKNMNQKDLTLL